MLIDVHIHEKTYSSDSKMELVDIISQAKSIGLDGICITDHESNNIMEKAHHVASEMNFLVLVGAEILTYEGDLLVFGLTDLPNQKMHAKDLIELVNKEKGIAISAHPYRQNGRGMGDFIKYLPSLSGVEGFNGSTPMHHNLKSFCTAKKIKYPIFGASDAHHLHMVGKYATEFPDGIRDELDFIDAVIEGNVQPVLHTDNGFKKFDRYCDFYKTTTAV